MDTWSGFITISDKRGGGDSVTLLLSSFQRSWQRGNWRKKKWEKRPLDVPSSSDAKVTWAWRLKKQAMSAPISQRAVFFFFFHSSYFQCSQEQKWPAIKTLLKHFCCCQRPRGGVPSPNAEMLSPRSSSLPLSILWAGRCKMSNNLIWASKFYGAFSRQEWGGVACASAPSHDLQSWTF